ALAQAIALFRRQRRPGAVLVQTQRQFLGAHRAPSRGASGKAEVEVRVPIEAEVRVEQADIAQDLSPHRQAITLDGVDRPRRRLVKVPEIAGAHSERPGDTDALI